MEWYLMPLQKYAQFSGRSRRKEYWMFFLGNLIIGFALGMVDAVTGIGFLGILYMLATLIPGIAVSIRRLHDTGKSGWWLLIGLVPLVGAIALIVFMATEGTRGPNEFGPDPKSGELAAAGI